LSFPCPISYTQTGIGDYALSSPFRSGSFQTSRFPSTKYVLDRPAVAGIIIGARLGIADHIADNGQVFGFALDADDLAVIEAVL
jgi:hypothetical protein